MSVAGILSSSFLDFNSQSIQSKKQLPDCNALFRSPCYPNRLSPVRRNERQPPS
jgi:hypothetical protein